MKSKKVKSNKLTGIPLSYALAIALGNSSDSITYSTERLWINFEDGSLQYFNYDHYELVYELAQKMTTIVNCGLKNGWYVSCPNEIDTGLVVVFGNSLAEAIAKCIVITKLGKTVKIPFHLLGESK